MNAAMTPKDNLDGRLKRGAKRLSLWTSLWLISTAAVAFGPKLLWDFNTLLSTVAIIINIVLGIKMVWVNKEHLDDMDEMQRKIHFNAMAVSLGSTFVLGTAYGLLEPAGLLASTPQPANLLFVMGISYLVTVVVNFRKYA